MDTSQHLGNLDLLKHHKTGFLAASYIDPLAVLPTLDWACAVAKEVQAVVVSGFASRSEKDVLDFLLHGECGIVVLLARKMYATPPTAWQKALEEGRMLVLSTSNATRQSKEAAKERNRQVCQLCDTLVLPSAPPTDSSLHPLYEQHMAHGKAVRLLVGNYGN